MNKNQECPDKFVSPQKNRTRELHEEVISLINTYIHTYINPQTPLRIPCDNAVL